MKASTLLSLTATLASTAVAQSDYYQSAPFTLKVVDAADAAVEGYAIGACHAGAALEGLCISPPSDYGSPFFLNYSAYAEPSDPTVGILVWNLGFTDGQGGRSNLSSPLSLQYNPGSNVAAAWISPSASYTQVGFDSEDKFYLKGYFDDSTFAPDVRPQPVYGASLYNWHACWNILGGYYYHSIAWVTTGIPHNPTCTPVNITRTFI